MQIAVVSPILLSPAGALGLSEEQIHDARRIDGHVAEHQDFALQVEVPPPATVPKPPDISCSYRAVHSHDGVVDGAESSEDNSLAKEEFEAADLAGSLS